MRGWIIGTPFLLLPRVYRNVVCGGYANVCRMLKDDRVHVPEERSIFNFKDLSDRMG